MWPRQPAQLGDLGLRSASVNKWIWVILAEVAAGCVATHVVANLRKAKPKKITRTEILVISTLLVFENTKTD